MSYCEKCDCAHCRAVRADVEAIQRIKDAWEAVEKAKPKPNSYPWYPADPWYPHRDYYGHCPSCGLKLEAVMGYCCPNAKCPVGLGPTICG